MQLDFNYDENTHLREWWKKVYNNFSILQKEFNENKDIWLNACTKEEAKGYIAELAGSSAEFLEALNEFEEAIENSDAAQQLNEILTRRILLDTESSDADSAELTENGIYQGVSVNTPSNTSGTLITLGDMQLFIPESGEDKNIYKRSGYKMSSNEWLVPWSALNSELEAAVEQNTEKIETKQDKVIFGSYTGNDYEERTISLGFTPSLVEVFPRDGAMGYQNETWTYYRGGMAAQGAECITTVGNLIEIVDGGFKVTQKTTESGYETYINGANTLGTVYYYKVYV